MTNRLFIAGMINSIPPERMEDLAAVRVVHRNEGNSVMFEQNIPIVFIDMNGMAWIEEGDLKRIKLVPVH